MNILSTQNLCKSYKGVSAVSGVSMHIDKGDIYGFVGENGAGKTTVIRLISGLAEPDQGSFSLFGIDSKSPQISEAKSKMGCIVEAVSLNRGMTALDNLRLQCFITNVEKSDEELISLIVRVGLDPNEVARRKAGHFSLGMKQRLGIAMAMVSEPEFLVLDEPMNGLDPSGFVEVRETIMSLHKQGVSFLISSHILSELEKICTKIGVISKGVLLREMSVEELHKNAGMHIIIQGISESDLSKLSSLLLVDNPSFAIERLGNDVLLKNSGDLNKLIKIIADNNILISKINAQEYTIEDFYMSIVKGEGAR